MVYRVTGRRAGRPYVFERSGPRPFSFEKAKLFFPNRFTLEHVPAWSQVPWPDGRHAGMYPAPQFMSDQDWYKCTWFPGEGLLPFTAHHCLSYDHSYPLGKHWLEEPYSAQQKLQHP